MALRIIDGVPGAGKTYFAVDHCLKSFYKYDPDLDRWDVKDPDTVLITNIEAFAMGESLEREMECVNGDVASYFNYEFLLKRFEGKRVVWIIDEAQGFFHQKFSVQSVFLFFQKARHLGFDIYLVTQDADLIAKSIRLVAEYYIRAVRRTLSLFGEFRYKFVDPMSGRAWRSKVLRRDPRVFCVYRSMVGVETEKLGSVPRKYLLLSVALLVGAASIFFGFVKYRFHRSPVAASVKAAAVDGHPNKSVPGGVPAVVGPSAASERHTVLVRVDGFFGAGSEVQYVVSDGAGRFARLGVSEVENVCGCHAEFVKVGAVYEVAIAGAPGVIAAWSGGAGGRGLSPTASATKERF